MKPGSGKYDDLCGMVHMVTDADAVVLLVLGGRLGSGFSVQAFDVASAKVLAELPGMLRRIADEIEKDFRCMDESKERN